jgi:hypothetical protein
MIARAGRVTAALLGCLVAGAAQGGIEPGEGVRLELQDGTRVTVVREDLEEDGAAHAYRYLPANLTVARRRDGAAEFSFLPYRRDEGSDIEGAIMHLLLRWGLSEAQVADLQRALRREADSLGVVVGAVPVRPWSEGRSWEITSRSAIGSILNRGLTSAGEVPAEPGSKLAMSFRFDGADAARIQEALRGGRRAWKDRVRFLFAVGGLGDGMRPAGQGKGAPDWVLERDLVSLLPVEGKP